METRYGTASVVAYPARSCLSAKGEDKGMALRDAALFVEVLHSISRRRAEARATLFPVALDADETAGLFVGASRTKMNRDRAGRCRQARRASFVRGHDEVGETRNGQQERLY